MWHYVQNGQGVGPIATAAVQALLQNGSLGMDALVWQAGMPNWAPARAVPEFASCAPPGMSPPPIPTISMPPKIPTTSMDPDVFDIEHNKVFAVLAYLGILFLVPLLAAPHSRFARYHTNQGLILIIAVLILSFGMAVTAFIPFVHLLLIPVGFLLPFTIFVFIVMGIIHAASGEYKPLPLIGHFQLLR